MNIVYLDFSEASGMVSHSILTNKPNEMHARWMNSESDWKLSDDGLKGLASVAQCHKWLKSFWPVTSSLPQGSVPENPV